MLETPPSEMALLPAPWIDFRSSSVASELLDHTNRAPPKMEELGTKEQGRPSVL